MKSLTWNPAHVKMNAIGDYYDIPNLKIEAIVQIEDILVYSWSPRGFSAIMHEAVRTTGDQELLDILAKTASDHIEVLISTKEKIAHGLADAVIRNLATIVNTKHVLLEQSQTELSSAGNRIIKAASRQQREQDLVRNFSSLLSQTDSCRNVRCDAKFSCVMEAAVERALMSCDAPNVVANIDNETP